MTVKALIRNGSRTGGNFVPIGMEEALRTATMWLSMLVHQNPDGLTLCAGREADYQLACDWAAAAKTENLFTDRAISAANAPSNPIKPASGAQSARLVLAFGSGVGRGAPDTQATIARMRKQGAKIISINPVKAGLSRLADQWLAIRPGTDAALINVLAGNTPCDYPHLASTGLSVLDVELLDKQLKENIGRTAILAGRGLLAHRNGSELADQIRSLGEEVDGEVLPAADHVGLPRNLTDLLSNQCEAIIALGSDLIWNSQTDKAMADYEGRIICMSDEPEGFEKCADLVFCGDAHDNIIALAARLGLSGFSDIEGNSPFANGYEDYQPMGAKCPKPRRPVAISEAAISDDDQDFPFTAISQKAHEGANRAVVFMNTDRAAFLDLSDRQPVWIKSKQGKVKAVLALMDEMNEHAVWSWGKELFSPLMPQNPPLRDAATGQPAWFDLQVNVEGI